LAVAWIVLSYLSGGAARGVALAALLNLNPAIGDGRLDFRLPTSIITMSATLAILTFVFASYKDHSLAIATLSEETSQLSQTLIALEQANRANDASKAQAIANQIVQQLKSLELYPADRQIAEIQRLVDQKVRPLSKQYARELKHWLPSSPKGQKQSLRKVWARLDPVSRFPSIWFVLPLSLTPLPATTANYGLVAGLEVFLYTLTALGLAVAIGRPLLSQLIKKARPGWRELIFTLGLFAMAVAGTTGTYLSLSDTPTPNTYTVIGLIAFPAYAWVITIGSAMLRDMAQTRAELASTDAKLRWAIARVNLISWYSRGVITRLLHGPIQNSMHITLIKMQNEKSKPRVSDAIAELTARISEASFETNTSDSSKNKINQDFAELLRNSISVWQEVANVHLEISGDLSRALAKDPAGGSIVLDLCNEQLSNAIRHGKATSVSLQLSLLPEIVKIEISHDAPRAKQKEQRSMTTKNINPGLGTKFLSSCSVSWSKTEDQNLSKTEIKLPLDSH
jgi:hypothetical protein